MKRTLLAAAIVILLGLPAFGQSIPDSARRVGDSARSIGDSTRSVPDTSVSAGARKARGKGKFLDADGDGIDDRLQGGGARRGRDRFIDRDGDGISDDRASGLGFKRGAPGGAGSAGTDPKGGGKRQGGKR